MIPLPDKDNPIQIYQGDSLRLINGIPDGYFDLIFLDPPYNIASKGDLKRSYQKGVYNGVHNHEWDKFATIEEYKAFIYNFLSKVKRVLSENGNIFCCGSYQNIYFIGQFLIELEFWILNEIIWLKPNPIPNMTGSRLVQDHENIIWARKNKNKPSTFNYQLLKEMNGNKQMKATWVIDKPQGTEIIKKNNSRYHPTQKPEELLKRIILGMSNEGDKVFDPFMGVGVTPAVCAKHNRLCVGIDKHDGYVEATRQRLLKKKDDLF